ncbi:MAG: DNA polymerase III subunit delta [Bacteroidia bacterium]|nr:DNA polymerase III subunit delta [Bacteroidia bacterium]
MAKGSADILAQFNGLLADIKAKKFSPIYILMGEEPYYNDILLEQIIENALEPQERDFNQTVVYAQDTSADKIISDCRRFPMFAPRQLIVVKEAQQLPKADMLEMYFNAPVPETVLVLAYTNKSIDKRTTLYKSAKKNAVVFESVAVKEWDVPKWIMDFVARKGYSIDYSSAELMAEHTGNALRKVVLEIDKLIKSLPLERKNISEQDIKENIGISREFSSFELCKAITMGNYDTAYKIAYFFGENPKKYPLTLTLGAMFFYFSKLLKCLAYFAQTRNDEVAIKKAGIFYPAQIKEYKMAMHKCSLGRVMNIISLIKKTDYKAKSGTGGQATEGELLVELISRIIH